VSLLFLLAVNAKIMLKPNKHKKPQRLTVSSKIFGGTHLPLQPTLRGNDITRIEALSDAVFAFSISLLIVSLEVPQTFGELKNILQNFLPFVATVSLVFIFWYHQYRFFRHYGLHDKTVIVLNAALLILILFYVYPLKFLFSLLLSMLLPINFFPKAAGEVVMTNQEFPQLIMIYSAGYAAIWMVFYFLYRHAWQKRIELDLSASERLDTQKQLRGALYNCLIGAAALCASFIGFPSVGGVFFLLIPIVLWANSRYTFVQSKKQILNT
jgi:uncharacterized membrane protein